jgi:transcriptional regulator with XRE-family HTH domain
VTPVPEPASPIVRRRRLAAELRRLRERADLTGDFVADRMGWSASKVSRIENAHTAARPAEIQKLLALYGIEGPYADELLALAQEAKRKGWWKAYSDALPGPHTRFIGLEAEAAATSIWCPEVVSGLLQTEDYAREVIRTANGAAPPGEIERRVEARMVRQQLLHRDPPFELTAVIDESVLMRRIGSEQIMVGQIGRLLELSGFPHLSLRILPLNGTHPLVAGGFILLQFGAVHEVSFHDVAYIEHVTDSFYIEAERDTFEYANGFRRLNDAALSRKDSQQRLARAQRDWQLRPHPIRPSAG